MSYEIKQCIWSDTVLAEIQMPVGSMLLTRSLTSGLCRSQRDPAGVFWGVGDRGPNIKPKDAVHRYGLEQVRELAGIDGAKIMPLPDVGPAIARFRLIGDEIVLEEVVSLHDAAGRLVTGLPTPASPHAEFEPVFTLLGEPLATDPNGADSEGIAAMPDGTFWIADEYGPSLLRVDRSGTVLKRWVPAGTGDYFAEAGHSVEPVLPALASARKLNRGFEAIAVSDDCTSLFVAFQSPLAHPDRKAHEHSSHLRIWCLDPANGTLVAEYAYPLDDPDSFRRDAAAGKVKRDDVKVSELVMLGDDTLLVLERITLSTKIYRVRLAPEFAIGRSFSEPASRPTLEQMSRGDLIEAGVPLLAKTLILSTDDCPGICGDLEGMILLSSRELLLANDSDFGIEGAATQFWRICFDDEIFAPTVR
ncbi:MAG: esterase-like activity of phytase family protein [Pseudomonadota bacterium]